MLKCVSFNFSLVFLAILVAFVVTVNVGEQGELQGLHDVTDAHSAPGGGWSQQSWQVWKTES